MTTPPTHAWVTQEGRAHIQHTKASILEHQTASPQRTQLLEQLHQARLTHRQRCEGFLSTLDQQSHLLDAARRMFESIIQHLTEALDGIAEWMPHPAVPSEGSVSEEDVVRECDGTVQAYSEWVQQVSTGRVMGEFTTASERVKTVCGEWAEQDTRGQRLTHEEPGIHALCVSIIIHAFIPRQSLALCVCCIVCSSYRP